MLIFHRLDTRGVRRFDDFSSDLKCIEIAVRPRKGSKAICSRCHQPAPGYDQLAERRFEFIPFWEFLVFSCTPCGASTELVDKPVRYNDAQELFCLDLYRYFDLDALEALAKHPEAGRRGQ